TRRTSSPERWRICPDRPPIRSRFRRALQLSTRGSRNARQADPTSADDLRDRHRAHRRCDLDFLPACARRAGHRLLQREGEFRCGRRPLPERQRHLSRRDRGTSGVGGSVQRRRRGQHAAQQWHSGSRKRHRDGQERLRRRRAVHRPGAARGAFALDAAQRLDHRPGTHPYRAGHLRAAGGGRQAGQQCRQQSVAGSAARNVQGVQRFRTGVGAVDPVVAAVGRRSERQLRTGHPADRSGGTVPGRADPQRRRHQVAGRGSGPVPGEVANADPQVRSVLQNVPGTTDAANTTFQGIRPTFPVLAANLANFGRIGVIYRKSLEQALVIFPALMAALITVGGGVPFDEGGKLDFKVDLQDPPPCSTGFIPPTEIRSPADTTLRELPTDLYCKTAQNDPAVVRGARNYPCQEFPGKRAPTIQLCRDPQGYIPVGSNPWRGPPVPYGTPVEDPRMTLPMNKFPFIPPQVDPDPGPPVVQLPPGVAPGPGPAPQAPFPLPVPPNDNGPPPPWPYYAPPDQVVPPYGRPAPPADGGQPLPAEAP